MTPARILLSVVACAAAVALGLLAAVLQAARLMDEAEQRGGA